MQLFFEEKFLSGKMVIKDAEKNPVYTGKKGFWTASITLSDNEGNKLAKILEYNSLVKKCFEIKVGKKKVATVKKKLSLINQKLKVKGLGWDIVGNFLASEYTIKNGDEVIATIKRDKLIAVTEGYSIDVVNDENALTVVCLVMVLNRILAKKKGKLLKKI
jgi:uncharacterized protein YxjI